MSAYEDDGPAIDEGPVVVRRTIHEAALRFEKSMGPGAPGAIGEAQDRMDKAYKAARPRAAARWRAIYRYLMGLAAVARRTRTVILETGESYDFENDRVIRPRARSGVKRGGGPAADEPGRNRRRRSGKGSR
jgi:hypothetical protein